MTAVAVVGAGIVGLAVAREVQRRDPRARVVVLDKETTVAAHQTGRNSGVVHAGIYYPPGSLKARLCRRGVGLLQQYCAERGIPYEACGKLIVALEEAEVPRLVGLCDRGMANGVPGLRLVDRRELREIEPAAAGVAGLHSPTTAIVDFPAVARSLAREVAEADGEVRLGAEVRGIRQRGGRVHVDTTHPTAPTLTVDRLIVCAGLHADRLARLSGAEDDPRIVPFRGDYFQLRPERRDLVRGLLYPVPDPRYPFLGIHLTKRIDGEVLIGPNAALAFAREGYRPLTVRPRELWETLTWRGFAPFARQHWRTGVAEIRRSLSRRAFIREAQRYVPSLRPEDVVRGPSGVRAQAMDADGGLVDDFRLSGDGRVLHVRNAPSPAATSSLAIAEAIVDQLG